MNQQFSEEDWKVYSIEQYYKGYANGLAEAITYCDDKSMQDKLLDRWSFFTDLWKRSHNENTVESEHGLKGEHVKNIGTRKLPA